MTVFIYEDALSEPGGPSYAEYAGYNEESDHFRRMFAQADGLPDPTSYRVGPHLQVFRDIETEIDTRLKAIDPRLDGDYLQPTAYKRNPSFRISTEAGHTALLETISVDYRRNLKFAGLQIGDKTRWQAITLDGVVEVPPFVRQGDHGASAYSQRACFAACYRMIYASLIGTMPYEASVVNALIDNYGSNLVGDQVYLRSLHTDEFRQVSGGKRIRTVSVEGADLSTIHKVADTFKRHIPSAAVYCIINLGSESGERIWHTNILTGSSEDRVLVHDPSTSLMNGKANRALSLQTFYERWAKAFNRAHFVICDDGAFCGPDLRQTTRLANLFAICYTWYLYKLHGENRISIRFSSTAS